MTSTDDKNGLNENRKTNARILKHRKWFNCVLAFAIYGNLCSNTKYETNQCEPTTNAPLRSYVYYNLFFFFISCFLFFCALRKLYFQSQSVNWLNCERCNIVWSAFERRMADYICNMYSKATFEMILNWMLLLHAFRLIIFQVLWKC